MIGFYHEYDDYGFLSNWYKADFEYVHPFSSTEQYIMYHKVLMFHKYDLAKQILSTDDPAECKQIGRKPFPEFDPHLWDRLSYAVAKRGIKAKFVQNEGIQNQLLETGNELLVECSPTDCKWGIGLDICDPDRLVVSKWRGDNLLGRILMEIREEIRLERLLSPGGKVRFINAIALDPVPEWNMKAGELKRVPQYYSAIKTYSDTLHSQHEKDCFLHDYSLYQWERAMIHNMGGGLPAAGFYEMKQEVYDIARKQALLMGKTH
ncbi:MAG: NADAR family protein [Clostridiales bacterium]|nr:NADAR family protein [Clostridiales bacterium]